MWWSHLNFICIPAVQINFISCIKYLPQKCFVFLAKFGKAWENSKELLKQAPAALVPTVLFGFPKLLSGSACTLMFYNTSQLIAFSLEHYYWQLIIRLCNIDRNLCALWLVKNPCFISVKKHRKSVFYCFSPHYLSIIKQMEKPRKLAFSNSLIIHKFDSQ